MAQDDDVIIIIEEDSSTDEAPDLIIIEEEERTKEQPPSAPGFDAIIDEHLLFRPMLRQDVFILSSEWTTPGTLSLLELTSGWLGNDWGIHLNGLWRWWVPHVTELNQDALGEWGAWYEFYLKQSWADYVHLQLGKQMVPWGLTQVFALGDRLQPSHRTPGVAFLEPVKGAEPLWGISLRNQFRIFSSEMVLMLPWNAERNYLNSNRQGHFQFGRYQEALGIGSSSQTQGQRVSAYMKESSALEQLALGFRLVGQIDEVTLGGSLVWGPDQTPVLIGAPDAYASLMDDLDSAFNFPLCSQESCDLNEGEKIFDRKKVGSFVVDGTWSFGLAIVKLEWLHYLSEIPELGKVVWLWSEEGLKSDQVSMDALALAVESGLGEWIEGSIELGLFRWADLPAETNLFGIEPMVETTRTSTEYYRPVVGTRLKGFLWPEWLSWSWANETGWLTKDHQNKFELALHWPGAHLFFGVFGEIFYGPVGTPGNFRTARERMGLMIGGGPW